MSEKEKSPKTSVSYTSAFGMLKRVQRPNGSWEFNIVWSRVILFLSILAPIGYLMLALSLFIFIKHAKGYEEMTFLEAIKMPFNMGEYRQNVSDYDLKMAKQYLSEGKIPEARANLSTVIGRTPKNLEARQILAELYTYLYKRPDKAIKTLEDALIYAKDNPQYIRMYIKLLIDQTEDAKVISVSEKLLAVGDIKKPEITAYLAMALSSVYAFHGDYDKSKEYLLKYKLDKTLPGILRLSKNEWEQGNRDEAVDILRKNFKYAIDKEPVYALLVNYYTAMKNLEMARQYALLRITENPFSIAAKMDHLRLLKNTGDEKSMQKQFEELIQQSQNDNRTLLVLANHAADIGDMKSMRRIYDISLKNNFSPAPYCLLLLETTLTNGDYKSATEFSDDILKGKPAWAKRYEDVIACLRAIAYYATDEIDMAENLLNDVLKRGTASAKVLIATARRMSQMGAKMTALKLLESTVDRFPKHQLALTRLIQLEIELGNSTNLDKHIFRLLQMRRPPRELVAEARKNLSSDRFIFTANRDKLMSEIDRLMSNTEAGTFSDDSTRISPNATETLDF